ncbi:JAB domain-containing protein [Aristophania vespae]|uniref:JAB domain-containing protein n=1 Tax=Aristophania vespae TaxID=2697033 RepID=UPI00235168E2|nr:DNA repair protein RadC [Aristophania vespae]UMM63184.1 hypothetical protein DM15PD_01400 [Aristophania vespae]
MAILKKDYSIETLLDKMDSGEFNAEDKTLLFRCVVRLFSQNKKNSEKLTTLLLAKFDTLAELICITRSEWKSFNFKDDQFYCSLVLLKEFAQRFYQASLPIGDVLQNEDLLIAYLVTCMARERVEQFRVLFLDKKNMLILDEIQGKGTVNQTPVYPREIARRCLELKATSVILAHNHPSGSSVPSKPDILMTQKVQQALNLIKVKVIDHYIIARTTHSSFRELGLLEL